MKMRAKKNEKKKTHRREVALPVVDPLVVSNDGIGAVGVGRRLRPGRDGGADKGGRDLEALGRRARKTSGAQLLVVGAVSSVDVSRAPERVVETVIAEARNLCAMISFSE